MLVDALPGATLFDLHVDLLTPGDLPPKFLGQGARGGAADMNENRLAGYLDHMQQAAIDACGFAEGLAKEISLKTSEPSRLSS